MFLYNTQFDAFDKSRLSSFVLLSWQEVSTEHALFSVSTTEWVHSVKFLLIQKKLRQHREDKLLTCCVEQQLDSFGGLEASAGLWSSEGLTLWSLQVSGASSSSEGLTLWSLQVSEASSSSEGLTLWSLQVSGASSSSEGLMLWSLQVSGASSSSEGLQVWGADEELQSDAQNELKETSFLCEMI